MAQRGRPVDAGQEGRGVSDGLASRPSPATMPRVIDETVVRHVARLARLGLSDDEIKSMGKELSVILDHVAQIQALDLDDVPITTHVVTIENVMRDDVPRESLSRELAMREAPESDASGIAVGKIG
jgi:aspartyl-tRNA(Asn)/glutamyl-tRNA(Gln) amidotransferase subunit C